MHFSSHSIWSCDWEGSVQKNPIFYSSHFSIFPPTHFLTVHDGLWTSGWIFLFPSLVKRQEASCSSQFLVSGSVTEKHHVRIKSLFSSHFSLYSHRWNMAAGKLSVMEYGVQAGRYSPLLVRREEDSCLTQVLVPGSMAEKNKPLLMVVIDLCSQAGPCGSRRSAVDWK